MSDPAIIDQLQAIKADEEKLSRVRARREAELEVAKRSRDEALRALKDEFGVSSIEEAEAELERREKAFRAEVEKVAQILREVGASG